MTKVLQLSVGVIAGLCVVGIARAEDEFADDIACRRAVACAWQRLYQATGPLSTSVTAPNADTYAAICAEGSQIYLSGDNASGTRGLYRYLGDSAIFVRYPASNASLPHVTEGGVETYYAKVTTDVDTQAVTGTRTTYMKYRRSCDGGGTAPNCPYYYAGTAGSLPAGISESAVPTITGSLDTGERARTHMYAQLTTDVEGVAGRYMSHLVNWDGEARDVGDIRQSCERINEALGACRGVSAALERAVETAYFRMAPGRCTRAGYAALETFGLGPDAPVGDTPETRFAHRARCGDHLDCIFERARRTAEIAKFSSPADYLAPPFEGHCDFLDRSRTFDTAIAGASLLTGRPRNGTYIVDADGRGLFVELHTDPTSGDLIDASGGGLGRPTEVPGETTPDGKQVLVVRVVSPYRTGGSQYLRLVRTNCAAGAPATCRPTYNSLGVSPTRPASIPQNVTVRALPADAATDPQVEAAVNRHINLGFRDLTVLTRMSGGGRAVAAEADALFALTDANGSWQPSSSTRTRTASWRSTFTDNQRRTFCFAVGDAVGTCQGLGLSDALTALTEAQRTAGCEPALIPDPGTGRLPDARVGF